MVRNKVKPNHVESLIKIRQNCSTSLHEVDILDSAGDSDNSDEEIRSRPKKKKRFKKCKGDKLSKDLSKNSLAIIKIRSSCWLKGKTQRSSSCYCLLGSLRLTLKDFNVEDRTFDNHWLYLNEGPDNCILHIFSQSNRPKSKIEKEFFLTVSGALDINLWKALGIKRYYNLVSNLEYNYIDVKVYLLTSAIIDQSIPSEVHCGLKSFSNVMNHFYGIHIPTSIAVNTCYFDPDQIYNSIKGIHHGISYSDQVVQHPGLIPKLRPYQIAAVKWMLYQENVKKDDFENQIHPLYIRLEAVDGTVLYYNKYGGFFIKDKPLAFQPCPGGILADEMGLGKTVEILACILNHPRVIDRNLDDFKNENLDNPIFEDFNLNKESKIEDLKTNSFIGAPSKCKSGNDDGIVDVVGSRPIQRNKELDILNSDSCEVTSPFNTMKILIGTDTSCVLNNETSCISQPSRKRSVKTAVISYVDEDDEEYEDEKCASPSKMEIPKTRRKRSARTAEIYFDNENEDVKYVSYSKPKTPRISAVSNGFDPEKEIADCSIRSIIEKVILEKAWNDALKDYKKEGSYKDYRKFLKMRKKDPLYLMTLRERLNVTYLNSISSYSATYALTPGARIKDFFETKVKQKTYFECVCGNGDLESDDLLTRIQCSVCKLYQHAECVHYNVTDKVENEYICPHCWSEQVPVISKATLIISPSSISFQWDEEIKKHLSEKSLKVFIYNGVSVHGYLQPRKLASYDIVITTYEVLRRELNYVDLPHSNSEAGRRFRHAKRFMAVPSPLPCIDWWRVCLDEAQMVECTTTKTAEMCHRLKAQIKWCVTGTPIQKSINDLQGLLQFLEVDPYGILQWWQQCLYNPYCQGDTKPLHDEMGKHMWRTSKIDVLNELGIPAMTNQIHWLSFTPVEEHFYKRLHSQCSSEALVKISKFTNKNLTLKSLDRQTLSSLLHPLLKLRHACNHPQIVKGQFTHLNRKTLTMEQLLENLIKKTQLEAEETHRVIIASLNGLAAVCIMREEFHEAVALYRDVLRSVVEEGKDLKTDLLQKLHTMHNLSELLETHKDTISERTLRDDNLVNETKMLREQYLKQYPQKILSTKLDSIQQTKITLDLARRDNYNSTWWLSALEAVDQEFVQEVRDELLAQYSRFQEHQCILYSVESRVQLMRLLKVELKKLETQRLDMIQGTKELSEFTDYEKLLNGAVDCHLRPNDNNPPKCILCVKHELFENLEQTLFFVKDEKLSRYTDTSKEINEKIDTLESLRKGNWGLSEIERILKLLQTKSLGRVDVQEDAQTQIQIFQHMKKEFKLYRIWWRSIYDYVSALDEVNMATLRYRLKLPGEVVQSSKKKTNDLETKETETPIYALDECELPQLELRLKSEKIISQNELRTKLGQMLYLNNLKTSDLGRKGGFNPEPCPICKSQLGEKWAVLRCGHSFCIDCITIVLKKFSHCMEKGNVKCPMCRQPTQSKEISYIDTIVTACDDSFKVQGSLSTKIEGIVRAILQIKAADPEAKVLVFSSWTEVLDVIADGFTQNGITFRILNSNNKFQVNLASFRSKQEIMALLIPLSLGANGLNLVEAHHVILVEPVLNPAAEVQAIGRVHRIGQMKATVIHRFIVRSTIEERIHQILSSSLADEGLSTIENLQQLFSQVEQETD